MEGDDSMANAIDGLGKIFLVFDNQEGTASNVDRERFFTLLTSMFSDSSSIKETDLDNLIASFSNPEVMGIVNSTLEGIDTTSLSGASFRPLIDELLSGLPSDMVSAINDWLDVLGIDNINDPNILLKLLILILVIVIMILKMQVKMMEAMMGIVAEADLDS